MSVVLAAAIIVRLQGRRCVYCGEHTGTPYDEHDACREADEYSALDDVDELVDEPVEHAA